MKILVLSPIPIFPTNIGDRVRIKGITLGLAKHHQITLIAPSHAKDNSNDLGEIHGQSIIYKPVFIKKSNFVKKVNSLFSFWPYHTALRYREELEKAVAQTLNFHKFDLIYCHFLQTLPYVKGVNIPIVLDQHNVDYIYWERQVQQYKNPILKWLAKRNLKKTIQFEQSILSRLIGIISVSEKDKLATQAYAKEKVKHFFVAPNGVDTTQFEFRKKSRQHKKLVLGFFGSMDLTYNEDAAIKLIRKILPTVQTRLPEIDCTAIIIGRNPSQKLNKIARQSKSAVSVTGTVDNVMAHLQRVDLLVLPLDSGAGTKLRVSESMAAGVPVIGSPLAVVGFEDYIASEHLMLAKNIEEFVSQICELALNPKKLNKMQQRARDLVEDRFSWRQITTQLAQDFIILKH